MKKGRNFFTAQEVQARELNAIKKTTLIFLALLSDKYKWKPEQLEKLMKEVYFATSNLGDLVTRKDLLEIIERCTGWKLEGKK